MRRTLRQKSLSLLLTAAMLYAPAAMGAAPAPMDADAISWDEKISADVWTQIRSDDMSPEDKIPVYVWQKDIDQAQVERDVEARTGLNENTLAVISNASLDLTEENRPEMALKAEEAARALEKEQTDTYLTERRALAKERTTAKNAQLLRTQNIDKADVLFESRYAPMMILNLTPDEIEAMARDELVESIAPYTEISAAEQEAFQEEYLERETERAAQQAAAADISRTIEDYMTRNGIKKARDAAGVTGQDVKLGVLEYDTVTTTTPNSGPDGYLPSSRLIQLTDPKYNNQKFPDYLANHVNGVACLCAGTKGGAPGVTVYSYGTNGGSNNDVVLNMHEGIEMMLDHGVSIITFSAILWDHAKDNNNVPIYDGLEKWTDYMISTHKFTFTMCTSNDGTEEIEMPGLMYNCISVGAYSERDNKVFTGSNAASSASCSKPDVIISDTVWGGGSSSATPVIAGIAALMMELRPSLATQPEAVKAIIMASCHKKGITSPVESMSSGITQKQGAGIADAFRAICITGSGHYAYKQISGGQVSEDIHIKQPAYGASGMNVSLAWSRDNTLVNGSAVAGTLFDMDLMVKYGTTSKSSASSNTNKELIYISPLPSTSDYTINVKKYTSTQGTVRYAYAWSMDKERYQGTAQDEGIFYIKNKNSGLYLNLNTSTGEATQESFTGKENQQWLLLKKTENKYDFRTLSGDCKELMVGDSLNSYQYKAVAKTNGTANAIVDRNDDGTVSISSVGNIQYPLDTDNSTTIAGRLVTYSFYNGSDSQKWYLEPLAYQKGDVDRDGSITTSDSLAVEQAAAGKITFNKIQRYLADVNNDRLIDTTDSLTILQMASGKI